VFGAFWPAVFINIYIYIYIYNIFFDSGDEITDDTSDDVPPLHFPPKQIYFIDLYNCIDHTIIAKQPHHNRQTSLVSKKSGSDRKIK
jgi:hypothetical protein